MRDGFDIANNRKFDKDDIFELPKKHQNQFGLISYFINETFFRISDRILHVTNIKDYENPYTKVMELNTTSRGKDEERLLEVMDFVSTTDVPFFASVHMRNTHGSKFKYRKQVFSREWPKAKHWQKEFYDDAILTYDQYVEELVTLLKKEKKWDNTIFIISSDHGMAWSTKEPIPLIIHFPKGAHAGKVTANSQRIDIAPTLLDYLGVESPDWFEGVSLLGEERNNPRIVFAADRANSTGKNGWRVVKNPKAPFFTLGSLVLINCDQHFQYMIKQKTLSQKSIRAHTAPCKDTGRISKKTAKKLIVEHLIKRKYDVSSIPFRKLAK